MDLTAGFFYIVRRPQPAHFYGVVNGLNMAEKMHLKCGSLLVCLLVGMAAADGVFAQESAEEIDSLRASYQTILDRNPFNLQPPPPPPDPEPEPEPEEEESPELDELNLKIAGVSAKDEIKRVWMSMTLPNPNPDLPPVERFFAFTESEDEHHGVKVTQIGFDGNVEIEFYGKSHKLDFEEYRYDGASTKKAGSKSNVKTPTRISARELIRRRALEQQKKNQGNTPTRGTINNRGTSSGSLLRGSGGSATRTGTSMQQIPTRQTRLSTSNSSRAPAKPAFTREEQILLMETQKAIADLEGRRMPPIPSFNR